MLCPQKFWNFSKSKLEPHNVIFPLNFGNTIILDDYDKAEGFRDYLASVFEKDGGGNCTINCRGS